MIAEKILGFDLDSLAMVYEDIKLSYRDLRQCVFNRSVVLSTYKQTLIVNHENPVKNVIDFLAAAHCGSKIIMGSFMKEAIDHVVVPDFSIDSLEYSEASIYDSSNFEFGILSSGSEGIYKQIWRTPEQWEYAFSHQNDIFNIPDQNKLFVLDALTYSANLNSTIHTLWNGGTVYFGKLSEAKSWFEILEKNEIDSIFLVPSHWRLLEGCSEMLTGVESCVSAGEKLSSQTAKGIMAICPNATLTEYYGAAELGFITYHQGQEIIDNPLSVGKPFPEVSLSISGNIIFVKSPYVAGAYKIRGSVNDLGQWQGGRLILLGRQGRMFNKRGLNIYAHELESCLNSNEFIKCCVLSYTHTRKLALNYELADGLNKPSKEDLWLFLERKLDKAKHPHFLKEVAHIPLTESGKIDYQELAKAYDHIQNLA